MRPPITGCVITQATNAEGYLSNLLIYLNSSNMKELLDIFKKDIEPEKFDDLECVVFGFLVPAAFLALCLVVSLL
jgi:hypothetical protein